MIPSDTQSLILTKASQHDSRLAAAPPGLPSAARAAVFRSMLKNGLVEECSAPEEYAGLAWRQGDDGAPVALRITDAGLRAIGVETGAPGNTPEEPATAGREALTAAAEASRAPEGVPPAEAALGAPTGPDAGEPAEAGAPPTQPTPAPRITLREASQAVLAAWDDEANRADIIAALDGPMERLRGLLAKPAKPATGTAPRKPREGTKQEKVLALLRRSEGASGPQIIEATGWAPHTVRGFFAGLKKKGHAVEVLERVRQVGPDNSGAKGSYSIYRVAEAG